MDATPRTPGHKTALITGASSGIGYELSKLFARNGYDLVLVARGQNALDAVAAEFRNAHGVAIRTVAADLSALDAVRQLALDLQQAAVEVDVLVNNAGYGSRGPFATSDVDDVLGMLQVNVAALTYLTRLFLPSMIARRSGKILNVASTAAFQPGPFMAVYYASKAYVLSLSEALADELRGTGVTVTALCPGPTATQFQQRAQMTDARLFNAGLTMRADEVARQGYAGLMAGRAVVVPGLVNRVGALSVRVMPRPLILGLIRRLHQRA